MRVNDIDATLKFYKERKYWAGGNDWKGTRMEKEFIEKNEWRIGCV